MNAPLIGREGWRTLDVSCGGKTILLNSFRFVQLNEMDTLHYFIDSHAFWQVRAVRKVEDEMVKLLSLI